jgi:hypothetical protein
VQSFTTGARALWSLRRHAALLSNVGRRGHCRVCSSMEEDEDVSPPPDECDDPFTDETETSPCENPYNLHDALPEYGQHTRADRRA